MANPFTVSVPNVAQALLGFQRARRLSEDRRNTAANREIALERLGLLRSGQEQAQSNADREFALRERALETKQPALTFEQRKELAQVGRAPVMNPIEKARQTAQVKADVKVDAERQGKARGAKSFLSKVDRVEKLIEDSGDVFGPLVGTEAGQFLSAVSPLPQDKSRVRKQQRILAAIRDLELDVARFKLKGQGQVTEAERKIARETLPQLTNVDSATALDILNQLRAEARETAGITAPVQEQQATQPFNPPISRAEALEGDIQGVPQLQPGQSTNIRGVTIRRVR